MVEPSVGGMIEYRPCRVTLVDGTVRDHVYVQEAESWFSVWGVDPEDDSGKQLVDVSSIVSIEESPSRLPVRFANVLYEAGESAMGGVFFALTLKDGRTLYCEAGGAVDFVDWPADVQPNDVVEVIPHAGRTRDDRVNNANHAWALYEVCADGASFGASRRSLGAPSSRRYTQEHPYNRRYGTCGTEVWTERRRLRCDERWQRRLT